MCLHALTRSKINIVSLSHGSVLGVDILKVSFFDCSHRIWLAVLMFCWEFWCSFLKSDFTKSFTLAVRVKVNASNISNRNHDIQTQQRQSINATTASLAATKKTNSDNHFDFNCNHELHSTFLNVNCSVVGTLPETATKVTFVITRHNHQLIQINCALDPSHNEEKILCSGCFVVCLWIIIFSSVLSLSPPAVLLEAHLLWKNKPGGVSALPPKKDKENITHAHENLGGLAEKLRLN